LRSDLTATREELLAQFATQGNRAAFGELTRRALPAVRSLLRRMGAQPALADDMAQDAFIAAFRSIAGFRAEGSFAGWVCRIAARLYIRRAQRDRRHEWLELPTEDLPQLAVHDAVAERIDLEQALQGLSPGERLCVTLSLGAGFTHEELARELTLPLGTVKSHVLRGTKKLRQRLGHGADRGTSE
jgi:RNA polymerase sigma factor (sigma-70 family)